MHDVKKSCMSKEPFKVQDRAMDFNLREYEKIIDMFQIPFCNQYLRNYHLSNFGVVSKNTICNYV